MGTDCGSSALWMRKLTAAAATTSQSTILVVPGKRGDRERRTSGTARAADLQELVLELEVLDELPDARPHRDACAELGERVRGLVDVEFDVLGVFLQEEREEEASEACTAVDSRQVSFTHTIREH